MPLWARIAWWLPMVLFSIAAVAWTVEAVRLGVTGAPVPGVVHGVIGLVWAVGLAREWPNWRTMSRAR